MMGRLIKKLKAPKGMPKPNDPSKMLSVEWDESAIHVRVIEGLDSGWNNDIPWSQITRVCFKDEGIYRSDLLLVWLEGKENPAPVLAEALGGPALIAQLVARDIFPKDIYEKAVTSSDGGLYCWPPLS